MKKMMVTMGIVAILCSTSTLSAQSTAKDFRDIIISYGGERGLCDEVIEVIRKAPVRLSDDTLWSVYHVKCRVAPNHQPEFKVMINNDVVVGAKKVKVQRW